MSNSVGIVAIIGRANVGKSSLYNAVLGRRQAIVAREAGTTRDSVMSQLSWAGKDFWLVDTAGFKPAEDDFELSIQDQVGQAAQSATAIWVVVDSSMDPTSEDRRAARMALKTRKPVILAVNKSEGKRSELSPAWLKLGIKDIIAVSASQKNGLSELLDRTAELLPKGSIKSDSNRITTAILGRPNAGKSTLFNSMGKKQQAVVSERAGTTRDTNTLSVSYKGKSLEFIDTAGIRRSGRIEAGAEKFSVLRALAAIDQADICILVMDAAEPSVALEQKIAGLVKEAGKGLIIAVNKYDLADELEAGKDTLSRQIARDFVFVPWAPLVFISAKTGMNVTKLFEIITEIHGARNQKIRTTELNDWLVSAVSSHPPAGLKNSQPRLNYIVQEDDQNWPSFKVFGRDTKLLHWSYRRYLEKSFRERWDFRGTAVKFWFIEKDKSR